MTDRLSVIFFVLLFSLPHYGGSARRAREAILLTTLADRDPQGTIRIRATCDLSLLVLSKLRFPRSSLILSLRSKAF